MASDGSPASSPDVTVVTLINALLRYRFLVIGLAMGSLLYVGVTGLRQPRSYSTTAAFLTQGTKAPSNLAGLAAQFGVSVPTAESSTSPAFYLDLLKSRGILRSVAEARFEYQSDTGKVSATLDRIFHVEGTSVAERREAAMKALEGSVSGTLNQKTGVVTFTVKTNDRNLSYLIATRLLGELNRFNLERRQSQAAAERKFAQSRLAEVRNELRETEDRMQSFLQRNREYRSSPDLVFDAERLQREIALRQQLYAALSQALEQAKIEEVRDTPVITLVEPPSVAVNPDRRGLVRRGTIALLVGAVVALLIAAAREFAGRAGAESRDELTKFQSLRAEMLFEVRHPLRALRREWRARAEGGSRPRAES